MAFQHTIKAVIRKGENQFVAECLEIGVVTQGATVGETLDNLQEAVSLHLEGEDLAELGLAPDPSILVTMEMESDATCRLSSRECPAAKQLRSFGGWDLKSRANGGVTSSSSASARMASGKCLPFPSIKNWTGERFKQL